MQCSSMALSACLRDTIIFFGHQLPLHVFSAAMVEQLAVNSSTAPWRLWHSRRVSLAWRLSPGILHVDVHIVGWRDQIMEVPWRFQTSRWHAWSQIPNASCMVTIW